MTTSAAVLDSVLTCPHCGHAKPEVMPTDACQFFYECEHCKAVLRPKAEGHAAEESLLHGGSAKLVSADRADYGRLSAARTGELFCFK